MRLFLFLFLLAALACTAAAADQNIHQLEATLTDCGCEYFTPPAHQAEWVCFADFSVAAPAPHFDAANPATVTMEIEGQAIAQCGDIQPLLPRHTKILFWVQGGGPDYILGIYRSGVVGYYLTDLGQP